MIKATGQMKTWMGKFGKEYTDRNAMSLEMVEKLYIKNFGVRRRQMNEEFIGSLPRSARILEVGSNVGNQLLMLQGMGFRELYGIEINDYALELSRKRTSGINMIRGSAFDIPFKTGYFDMVFTSDVLIHIAPSNIKNVIKEIYRCSKRYIWGFEYYADSYQEVIYRGNKDLMWKADFPGVYLDEFPDLKIVKKNLYKYMTDDNVDVMFLLEKANGR